MGKYHLKNFDTYNRLKTLIKCGAQDKFIREIDIALSEGFPIDFTPYSGTKTLYEESTLRDDEEITLHLIAKGANINPKSGLNPYLLAVQRGWSLELTKEIILHLDNLNKIYSDRTLFSILCYDYVFCGHINYMPYIKQLLEFGADPNLTQDIWASHDTDNPNSLRRRNHLISYLSTYEQQKEELTALSGGTYEYEI